MPDHLLSRRDLIAAGASGAALLSASSFALTSVAARQRRNPLARAGTFGSEVAVPLPNLDEQQSALVTERLPVANPHLKFAHFRNHGYVVMEAGPDSLEVTFRAVDTVKQPDSRAFDLARFRVRSGVPVAEQV